MSKIDTIRKQGRSVFFKDDDSIEPIGDDHEIERSGDAAIREENIEERLRVLLNAMEGVLAGDFTVRVPEVEDGLVGQIEQRFNAVVALNNNVANEIDRVSRVIDREGLLTERIALSGLTGTWATEVNAVNKLINNLAQPINEIARVISAVAEGDLSQRMDLDIEGEPIKGEFLRIATTTNTMVEQLSTFASEVTRVAREVGTEGQLGGKAEVRGVAGTWKELTDNVNAMAGNLTDQVRNIADVTTAVALGDLSRKITVEAQGEILQLKDTINTMVEQLNAFASEVTRVAREVGTEGKLGGQAAVQGVAGTWKELTDNVNAMAGNLTDQVRNIAEVTTAVAQGDLSRKITVEAQGEILQLKDTINTMVEQLSTFASEVTRVAREVGTEGKLGGKAEVQGVAGTWEELTDNVNAMAGNLTDQVRNIAEVTTAVAQGDLSRKITVEAQGEILQLKDTVNTMVEQLSTFASEVIRVAREVGAEGKLGGKAEVQDVAGTWEELTDNVNAMAGNLTDQVRNIAEVTTAVAQGDLSRKITVEAQGEILQLKDTINTMVEQLSTFASEVTRVAREVGAEGQLGGQAAVLGVAGTWKELTDNVNMLAGNLTGQVRNIAEVTTAVAQGDLSRKITVEAQGEILQLKDTINTMVEQLSTFASEVTRVAREVGTEGKLGGKAEVQGVAGTWKELTDNVNAMAGNLTDQVRNIAEVTTAVAQGDLSRNITVEAQGEILQLKDTVNGMVDNLSMIIGNINEIMVLVGDGNLTRRIDVEAAGEFSSMVSGINGTIESLRGIVTELTEAGVNIGGVSQNLLNSGQEMNAMTTQLSSSVAQFADGAKAQATQIAEASTESEEVGKTASQTLTASESMNQLAMTAQQSASEGSRAMEETVKNTDLMLEGSKNSVVSIESLSKSSEQIQEIVEVIRDIATQTNILAINAAIEAVRAGKQGKGFSVVAEEVKTLSADSKTQAKKISTLVRSVQRETEETVQTIGTMATNVELGKSSIEQTSKAFGDIAHSIESTSSTAKEISEAAADQKKSIDAISGSLDKISSIADDTSTGSIRSAESSKGLLSKMQELNSTATTLAGMSEKFQQIVGRFSVLEESHTRAKVGSTAKATRPGARKTSVEKTA